MQLKHTAVVAGLALGLISGTAKAATLEYNVLIPFNDGNAITGTIDTDAKPGVLSSSDIRGYDLFYAGANVSSSDPASSFSVSGNSLVATGNVLQFEFNGSFSSVVIGGSKGSIFQFVAGTGGLSVYDAAGNTSTSVVDNVDQGTVLTIGVSEGSVMSPVPLPASAPMFGAALLALGAVGYGVKRKKDAAAV